MLLKAAAAEAVVENAADHEEHGHGSRDHGLEGHGHVGHEAAEHEAGGHEAADHEAGGRAAPGEEESEKLPENLRNRSQPQHGVDVAGFSAGKFEVTRGQYRAFVEATGRSSAGGCWVWTGSKFEIDQAKDCRNPGYAQEDPHPVACVSWEDAKA